MRTGFAWFAHHELRLALREWLWWLKGRRYPFLRAGVVAAIVIGLAHLLAAYVVTGIADLASTREKAGFVTLTGVALIAWMLMLSQAMEAVTRVLYARGDVELILSSPAPAPVMFAFRLAGIAGVGMVMALLLLGPFVNMLAWHGGAHWLGGYGVIVAMAASATAIAILSTLGLFHLIGPRQTRVAAQIAAALVGAIFVIGMQVAAIMSQQGLQRLAMLRSETVIAAAPEAESLVWWPARAAMGEPLVLATLLTLVLAALVATIGGASRRFADHVVTASGAPSVAGRSRARHAQVRVAATPSAALRAKELRLIARDPWLLSQTLMQLLYLVPPALLLWQGFSRGADAAPLVVPVVVMAAGQLAGGLAWLSISGEDAPELISSAPVEFGTVMTAKAQAVLLAVLFPMAPLVLGISLLSISAAVACLAAIYLATAQATAIQLLFRSTSRRSLFRRRQVASKVATFAESLSSISWAGAAALAAGGSMFCTVPALVALAILGIARMLSPVRPA